jgi:hypothetical protein
MKTTKLLTAATVFATTCAMSAVNLPKEGSYDYTTCWSGTSSDIVFSKTHTANSYEMMGTIMSNPPGGPFDKSAYRCVGMGSMINGKAAGGNVCEVVDADGDKRLSQYTATADGKFTRELVAGTGKYEGMVMTTIVTNIGPFPPVKAGTFQGCNRQTGTYKLK